MNWTQAFTRFGSKSVLLGWAMIAAGVYLATGIDIPSIPELEIIASVFPGDSGTLISGGLALIFVKDAIVKAGA